MSKRRSASLCWISPCWIVIACGLLVGCVRGGFDLRQRTAHAEDRGGPEVGLGPFDARPFDARPIDAARGERGASSDRGPADLDPGFTPAALPGLGIWLAADRIQNVADGAPVSAWANLEGQGITFSKVPGRNAPVLRSAGLAGKSVVRFDGVGAVLVATVDPALGLFASQPTLSIFALVHPLSTTAQMTILNWGDPADNFPGLRLAAWRLGGVTGWDLAAYDGVPGNGGTNTYRRVHATGTQSIPTLLAVVASPSELGLYRDGGSIGVLAIPNATFPLAAQHVVMSIGGQHNGFNWLDGDVAELIVFHRVVSAAERQQLEGYLAHRWGTASSLPATHPFKLAPPP